jgi:hypothetical protein
VLEIEHAALLTDTVVAGGAASTFTLSAVELNGVPVMVEPMNASFGGVTKLSVQLEVSGRNVV